MKALLRRSIRSIMQILYIAPYPRTYEQGAQAGYIGWYEIPRTKIILAFIRDDMTFQYGW